MNNITKILLIALLTIGNNFFSYAQDNRNSNSLYALISKNYKVTKTVFNSPADDIGGFVQNDTLYFSSNAIVRNVKQYVTKDNSYLYNIYSAPLNALDKKSIVLIEISSNRKLDESLPVITKNGRTMYYTGTYEDNKNVSKYLNILRASKTNGVWGNVEFISLNSKAHSDGQAVLNETETKLYFVSDRDTVHKNSNIYEAAIDKDGMFSEPQKLGRNINTASNEIAPFISAKNELYFASDREGGFGGFDVYYIDLNDKDAQPINLGNTINSKEDDFSFSLSTSTAKGFLTSNGSGHLEISAVSEQEPIQLIIEKYKKQQFDIAQDKKYLLSLEENKIISANYLSFVAEEAILNKEGKEFLNYLIGYIRKKPEAIIDVNALIDTTALSNKLLNGRIDHVVEEINKTTKYAYHSKIEAIKVKPAPRPVIAGNAFYFTYNSSFLSATDKEQLFAIAVQLKADKSLLFVFSTNADSRGTSAYNLWLSKKRLNAIYDFYKALGLSRQISGTAAGETLLLNKCANGVICTDEEHTINRRVGYKLTTQKTFLKLKE